MSKKQEDSLVLVPQKDIDQLEKARKLLYKSSLSVYDIAPISGPMYEITHRKYQKVNVEELKRLVKDSLKLQKELK